MAFVSSPQTRRANIPVLDTVFRFPGLDSGVSESHLPFPMTVVRGGRGEMVEVSPVRGGCPGLKDFVSSERFRDRHWWVVVRRRAGTVGNPQSRRDRPSWLSMQRNREGRGARSGVEPIYCKSIIKA